MAVRTPLGADPSGPDLITHLNARTKTLFDASRLPLTDVAGTADAVTATLDPALDGDGLVDGMTFGVTWGAANTGGVTLAINGGTPVPVLNADGSALDAGALAAGLRSTLEYVGGNFVLQGGGAGGASAGGRYWVFTASGTWTVPTDLSDDALVLVRMWGGGGGGHSSGGGGSGCGYCEMWLRAGDLGTSVSITVGAGGAVGANGGDTTFGAHGTAYGGTRARVANGGGGAGTSERGTDLGVGGYLGGGDGGTTGPGLPASSMYGGGGGGGTSNGTGGRAVYGGGGGGAGSGAGSGVGGASLFGGDGGDSGIAGSVPGGGGGRNAPGGGGKVEIFVP